MFTQIKRYAKKVIPKCLFLRPLFDAGLNLSTFVDKKKILYDSKCVKQNTKRL